MTEATTLILIVDDDASVRGGLSRLLRSAGYRTGTAASAREVLDRGRVMEKMGASSAIDLGQLCSIAGMKALPPGTG